MATVAAQPDRQSARMSKIPNDGLTRMLYSCAHMFINIALTKMTYVL